jgi:hypothetical protein
VHFEGTQRELVERRREHDGGRALAEQLEHFEPRELRHLDVEEHQVGIELLDQLHGLEAVRGLAHDGHVRDLLQVLGEDRAGQGFIVDDQNLQGDTHTSPRSADGGQQDGHAEILVARVDIDARPVPAQCLDP